MTVETWAECYPELEACVCNSETAEYRQLEASLKRATSQIDACAYGSSYEQAVYAFAMLLMAESECGARVLGLEGPDAIAMYEKAFERISFSGSVMPFLT